MPARIVVVCNHCKTVCDTRKVESAPGQLVFTCQSCGSQERLRESDFFSGSLMLVYYAFAGLGEAAHDLSSSGYPTSPIPS